MGPVEKCHRYSGTDKRNVHDVALIGGSARIPIVQKMIHECFAELLVLPSTRMETVLPMSWEG